jgi:rhodanese-related sulfurtransferase
MTSTFEILTPQEISSRLKAGESLCMVDVREQSEWDQGHISGALHRPLGNLISQDIDLPRDQDIIMYCHHGRRSAQACLLLRAHGFDKVYNMAGGIDAWSSCIDPSIERY